MRIKENRNFIIWNLVAVIIICFLFWDNKKRRNSNDFKFVFDLTFISGTVGNQLKSDVAEQGGPYVLLRLNEFPEFKFDVTEVKYKALHARDFVSQVNINDTVSLGILVYDYDTKLRNKRPLRLSERFVNYSHIEPYEIKAKGKTYMTVGEVNNDLKHDRSWYWALYMFGGIYLMLIILVLTGVIKRQDESEG